MNLKGGYPIKITPKIYTISRTFSKYLVDNKKETIRQNKDFNNRRDRFIITDRASYYLKLQREPKYKCEWHYDCEEMHLSINKDLLFNYSFDYLVIWCNGIFYQIEQNIAQLLSKVRVTESQGELIANIPMKQFRELEVK